MEKLKTPAQYLSTMALTFEAANLDFAYHYMNMFKEIEDDKTADILAIVLQDEISHVGFGISYLEKWREKKTLWNYYQENLPWPLTPARSKGKECILEIRRKAKMKEDFLSELMNYKDDFKVTQRKEWKK